VITLCRTRCVLATSLCQAASSEKDAGACENSANLYTLRNCWGKTALGNSVRVLVTGAGGFIGHHLVSFLRAQGYWVRGADLKPPEFGVSDANEFELLDLRRHEDCVRATAGIHEVFALAAETGGMEFVSSNLAHVRHGNSLIDLHCIEASKQNRVTRYLYASSASVYPESRQMANCCVPLKEEEAAAASPQGPYGLQKLAGERLCIQYRRDYGLETRIARLHSIFGPCGAWLGGREKAPAALCRKIAAARLEALHEIEIWGDGEQTRSFCYIDDCVTGLHKLMRSDYCEPLNLGQDRMVSINELARMIAAIAGVQMDLKHVSGPQGVRGRNSDNTRLKEVLRWEPQISLEEGLRRTYLWIERQVRDAALDYSFGVATFPRPPREM
jgi:GDP-D-mannose 3', 5'-epimerase